MSYKKASIEFVSLIKTRHGKSKSLPVSKDYGTCAYLSLHRNSSGDAFSLQQRKCCGLCATVAFNAGVGPRDTVIFKLLELPFPKQNRDSRHAVCEQHAAV